VPTLESVACLDLPGNVDGSYTTPTLQFTANGRTLMVQDRVVGDDVMGWLRWHTPDIAAMGLVVSVVLMVVVMVRTLRRPQARNAYYCQRCNYDLTGPGGMPPERLAGVEVRVWRCPECGVGLAKKPARLGRTAWSRMGRWVTGCMVVAGLSAAGLWVSLDKAGPGVWGMPWMPRVSKVLGMVGMPEVVHTEFCRADGRLLVASWGFEEDFCERWPLHEAVPGMVAITSDGRHAVYVAKTRRGMGGNVRVRRLEDGANWSVDLRTVSTTHPWPIVAAADPSKVFVCANVYPRGVGPYTIEFFEVDVQQRTSRALGAAAVPASPKPGEWTTASAALREVDAKLVWAVVRCWTDAAGATVADVVTQDGRVFPLPGSNQRGHPVLSRDGQLLEMPTWAGRVTTSVTVSLADGSTTSTPGAAPGGWVSEVAENGWSVRLGPPATPSVLEVVDAGGVVVATLAMGNRAPGGPVAISADGRWAAGSCTWTETDWLGNMRMKSEVRVWELGAVR